VGVVGEDAAEGGVVEAGDEAEEAALAGAGEAEDADDLAGPGLEGDVPEDGLAGEVFEGDVVEDDLAGESGGREGAGFVGDVDGGVEDLEDAPGGGEALLDGVGDGGEVGDLRGELLEESGEDDESAAEGDAVVEVEPAAVGEEDDEAELGEDLREGGEEGEIPEDAALLGGDLSVGVFEAPDLVG